VLIHVPEQEGAHGGPDDLDREQSTLAGEQDQERVPFMGDITLDKEVGQEPVGDDKACQRYQRPLDRSAAVQKYYDAFQQVTLLRRPSKMKVLSGDCVMPESTYW